MINKIKNYFYNKISSSRQTHPIYILPTLDGLKVVFLNIVLLTMGLTYANNYILLLNFVLFCLFLGSMFYTHFNLSGLRIISVSVPSIHVGETKELILYFTSSNSQGHHFLTPGIKSSLISLLVNDKKFSLSKDNNYTLKIPISALKRGREKLDNVYLETLFPFHFFRCFTFFSLQNDIYIYPEIKQGKNSFLRLRANLLNKEADDFFIRDFHTGDSLKRVDWKKLAQTNKWYTRQPDKEKPEPVILECGENENEESLSSICYSIHELHNLNASYGLKIANKKYIQPTHSAQHLQTCLRELANYGH